MKDVFSLGKKNHPTRTEQLSHPNPRTVTYGLESFGYKACQIWRYIPNEIKNTTNINVFKKYTSENCSNLCKCNLCKQYIANLGYIQITIQFFFVFFTFLHVPSSQILYYSEYPTILLLVMHTQSECPKYLFYMSKSYIGDRE